MSTSPVALQLLRTATLLLGTVLVAAALQDSFEVVLLPRRVKRRLRFMHYFFRGTWACWSRVGRRWPPGREREGVLAIFGPLSMVLLFTCWAVSLVLGFALLQWSLRIPASTVDFGGYLVMSGRTFFTLGSNVSPSHGALGQMLIILEAGTGFGFIALMVSYLPVLYQHFSRRDAQIIELDTRAGSPPQAGALLVRYAESSNVDGLLRYLIDWERWAADLAESHSAYPMLAFYRSQHQNNSWLASLTVLLDVSTLLMAGAEQTDLLQAASSYAAARRVLVELTSALNVRPAETIARESLLPSDVQDIESFFESTGRGWPTETDVCGDIHRLRLNYELMLEGLSSYLLLPLPSIGQFKESSGVGNNRTKLIQRLMQIPSPAPTMHTADKRRDSINQRIAR